MHWKNSFIIKSLCFCQRKMPFSIFITQNEKFYLHFFKKKTVFCFCLCFHNKVEYYFLQGRCLWLLSFLSFLCFSVASALSWPFSQIQNLKSFFNSNFFSSSRYLWVFHASIGVLQLQMLTYILNCNVLRKLKIIFLKCAKTQCH